MLLAESTRLLSLLSVLKSSTPRGNIRATGALSVGRGRGWILTKRYSCRRNKPSKKGEKGKSNKFFLLRPSLIELEVCDGGPAKTPARTPGGFRSTTRRNTFLAKYAIQFPGKTKGLSCSKTNGLRITFMVERQFRRADHNEKTSSVYGYRAWRSLSASESVAL